MNPLPIIVKKCVVNRSFIDLLEVLQAVTMFSRYRCLPWTLFAVVLANIFCCIGEYFLLKHPNSHRKTDRKHSKTVEPRFTNFLLAKKIFESILPLIANKPTVNLLRGNVCAGIFSWTPPAHVPCTLSGTVHHVFWVWSTVRLQRKW